MFTSSCLADLPADRRRRGLCFWMRPDAQVISMPYLPPGLDEPGVAGGEVPTCPQGSENRPWQASQVVRVLGMAFYYDRFEDRKKF